MPEGNGYQMARAVSRVRAGINELQGPGQGSLGDLVGTALAAHGLRGLWCGNSWDEAGRLADASGQARWLTSNGGLMTGQTRGLVSYVALNGLDQWLSRAHEAGLDISGELSVGGWYWADSLIGDRGLLTKDNPAGTRGYALLGRGINASARLEIWREGTSVLAVESAPGSFETGRWHCVIGTFSPVAIARLFIDGEWVEQPAGEGSIQSNTVPLNVGGRNGAELLAGRVAFPFPCAAVVSSNWVDQYWSLGRLYFGV